MQDINKINKEIAKLEHDAKRYSNVGLGIGFWMAADTAALIMMFNNDKFASASMLCIAGWLAGIAVGAVTETKRDIAERRVQKLRNEMQHQK